MIGLPPSTHYSFSNLLPGSLLPILKFTPDFAYSSRDADCCQDTVLEMLPGNRFRDTDRCWDTVPEVMTVARLQFQKCQFLRCCLLPGYSYWDADYCSDTVTTMPTIAGIQLLRCWLLLGYNFWDADCCQYTVSEVLPVTRTYFLGPVCYQDIAPGVLTIARIDSSNAWGYSFIVVDCSLSTFPEVPSSDWEVIWRFLGYNSSETASYWGTFAKCKRDSFPGRLIWLQRCWLMLGIQFQGYSDTRTHVQECCWDIFLGVTGSGDLLGAGVQFQRLGIFFAILFGELLCYI